MARSNIIQFAPALRRWRERNGGRVARNHGSWDIHYPAGIDGLWIEPATMGTVVPFPRS